MASTNGNGQPPTLNEEQMRRLERLVANVTSFRSDVFRQFFDPRRNIDDECGYPQSETGIGIGTINPEFFRALYEREPIATRVVQLMPKECWQVCPIVYEDESPDTVTDFELAWDTLGQALRGDNCWFQDEKGSPTWEYLRRVDMLSGIGSYGVLLLGFDDGKNLDQPVDGVATLNPDESTKDIYGTQPSPGAGHRGTANEETPTPVINERVVWDVDPKTGFRTIGRKVEAKDVRLIANAEGAPDSGWKIDSAEPTGRATPDPYLDSGIGTDSQYIGIQLGPPEYPAGKESTEQRRLLFVRAFSEDLVQIVQYEANVRSPRFGMPVMYRITLNDPREMHSGIGLPMATVRVHWSRVIHVADNMGSSEIFGVPRMRPVLNRILDLRKLYAGAPEGYWKTCFTGLSLETTPQLGADVDVDVAGTRDMLEQYWNGLQKGLILTGMTAKTLAPSVIDPSPFVAVQIEAICIQLGCPVRVFKGSERGELASSQDDDAWLDRLRERQNNYLTPRIIVPFIDRLIQAGVLPAPKKAKGGGSNKPVKNAAGRTIGWKTRGGYSVEWPNLDALSQTDIATIALTKTQALAAFVGGNCEAAMSLHHFYTDFLKMPDEQAEQIIDDAKDDKEPPLTTPPPGELGHPATPKPKPSVFKPPVPGAKPPGAKSPGAKPPQQPKGA